MEYSVCLLLLLGIAASYADRTFYMDSSDCDNTGYIQVGGDEVTVKSRSLLGLFTPRTACELRLHNSNGGVFDIDFDKGRILDCNIVLTLYNGQSTSSPILKKFTCNNIFTGHRLVTSSEYVTIRLDITPGATILRTGYEFEMEIEAKGKWPSSNWTREYWHSWPAWIIACIVISVLVSLLCCIVIPIVICCCQKRHLRRRSREVPVVYQADPYPNGTLYSHGQPTYVVKN